MCFRTRNKPVRLAKKPENPVVEFVKALVKSPEFWVVIAFIIIFLISIYFAYQGAIAERVYNLGNITG